MSTVVTSGLASAAAPWRQIDKATWDAFLGTTRASFQNLAGLITPIALRRRVVAVRVSSSAGADRGAVLAQAAVAVGKGHGAFLDALAVAPDAESRWSELMAATLAALPAGTYTYGSRWNDEPPRDAALATIAGVSVVATEPYMIDVIDLDGIADDTALDTQRISKHHRRHLKSAAKLAERVVIDARVGRAGLGLVKPVTALRKATYDAKQLGFSSLRSAAGLALKIVSLGSHARTSLVVRDGEAMGCYVGAVVGRSAYYIHGGNKRSNEGLAHALMLHHVREMTGKPGGRFVMGFAAGHDAEGAPVDGHRQFRFGFGAEARRGAIVTFNWAGTSASTS